MKHPLALLIYIICLCTSCGGGGKSDAAQDTVQEKAQHTGLAAELSDFVERIHAADSLGLCVYDLTTDKPVYGYRDDIPMSTASCLKLLTGMTALHELGSGYDFRTTFEHIGSQRADTLCGTFVVRGSIDPLLNDSDIVNVAEALVEKGISVVRDSIVLSFSEEDGLHNEAHWMPGDIKKSQRGVNAFPRETREKHILWSLKEGGIDVTRAKVVWLQNAKRGKVLEEVRHTLHQVVWAMWSHSSNVRSEGILCAMSLHNHSGKPFRTNGIKAMQRYLEENVPQYAAEATLHDGCGLCPENRMSARLLCALLRHGWHSISTRQELLKDLPISGIRGTLVREMKKSPAKGKVMAKTGTLTRNGGITSAAGYCKDANGHMLAFCILSTPSPTSTAHQVRAQLCEILTGTAKHR